MQALIVQKGNAYEEGLREFWAPLKRYWASGEDGDEIAQAIRSFLPKYVGAAAPRTAGRPWRIHRRPAERSGPFS